MGFTERETMNGMNAEVVVLGRDEKVVREGMALFERFGMCAVGADGIDSLLCILRQSKAQAVLMVPDHHLDLQEDCLLFHVVSKNTDAGTAASALLMDKKTNGRKPFKEKEGERE